jgi:hypothetical protein
MAVSPKDHVLLRVEPRMTANELARFMVAGDTGRIGIIRRARESNTPTRTRYRHARKALRSALCDPVREKSILAAARAALEQMANDPSGTSFTRDDAEKSVDVIDAFTGMRNRLAGFDFVASPKSQLPLILSGVEVSVHCDLLIHRDMKEVPQLGALLFRLTQSEEEETEKAADKRKDMGLYAATLVHMHATANLAGNRTPFHQLSWSVDVQNGEVHVAPKTYLTRAKAMENACRFIAAMWDIA